MVASFLGARSHYSNGCAREAIYHQVARPWQNPPTDEKHPKRLDERNGRFEGNYGRKQSSQSHVNFYVDFVVLSLSALMANVLYNWKLEMIISQFPLKVKVHRSHDSASSGES